MPPGTEYCLKDHTDFPVGTSIAVPGNHDFRVGDPIVFKTEGVAKLDTALTVGTTYYVVAKTANGISVSATDSGTPITLTGNGGSGTGDTVGDSNHIGVSYASYQAMCQAREFSISLSRESLDVTTLPCGVGASGGKYANFRATQAGYASGEGTVSVYFTSDKKTMANRLLGSTMLKSQLGAWVKLYINTVDDGTGKPKDVDSLYVEAPVSITGLSFSVNPDDAITAELSFTINGQPKHLFDMDL
jgi:hypothetical protein